MYLICLQNFPICMLSSDLQSLVRRPFLISLKPCWWNITTWEEFFVSIICWLGNLHEALNSSLHKEDILSMHFWMATKLLLLLALNGVTLVPVSLLSYGMVEGLLALSRVSSIMINRTSLMTWSGWKYVGWSTQISVLLKVILGLNCEFHLLLCSWITNLCFFIVLNWKLSSGNTISVIFQVLWAFLLQQSLSVQSSANFNGVNVCW